MNHLHVRFNVSILLQFVYPYTMLKIGNHCNLRRCFALQQIRRRLKPSTLLKVERGLLRIRGGADWRRLNTSAVIAALLYYNVATGLLTYYLTCLLP